MAENKPGPSSSACKRPILVVHSGAGAGAMIQIDPGFEQGKKAGVIAAIKAGWQVLNQPGGSALDAVQKAVEVFEEDPYANAGIGSCMTESSRIQMDASLMDGRNLTAGGVMCVEEIVHPITAARLVMDKTDAVMLCGQDATKFAHANGLPKVPQTTLETNAMKIAFQQFKEESERKQNTESIVQDTVGAVAIDTEGNVAYATSTGGRVGKTDGRVGDTAIPGHGGYADNEAGAATCTGVGQSFSRTVLSYHIINQLKQGGHPQSVCEDSVSSMMSRVGGYGGVIAVSRRGEIAVHYSSSAMAWAYVSGDDDLIHSGLYHGDHETQPIA